METQKFEFRLKKVKIEFWLVLKRNHLSFVNISPAIVIDTYINEKVFTSSNYNMETLKLECFSKKF